MASISSATNSLGNTSLRGYGGMASGIDRDAIIEQMTAGTNAQIWTQESAITKLGWKQEAYRGVSDKILDLYDNYCSYTSSTSLKDPNSFAKSLINVLGKEDSTRFVTASGASALVDNVAIQAVRRLASASVLMSGDRPGKTLNIKMEDLGGRTASYSNLMGSELRLGKWNGADGGKFEGTQTIKFANSYTDADGKVHQIDYFPEDEEGYKKLAEDLNNMLKYNYSNTKLGNGDEISDAIEFKYNETSKKMEIVQKGDMDGYTIQSNSTALKGLGYTGKTGGVESISVSDYNSNLGLFENSVTTRINTIEYLKNEKLTFNYDGNSKDIVLITEEEARELLNVAMDETKLQQILGYTDAEYQAAKDKIIADIRAEEKAAAEADANKKLENQALEDLTKGDFTDWLRAEVKKDHPELAGKPNDDKDLLAAMDKKLREEGVDSLMRDMLAEEAENKGGAYVSAEVQKTVEKELDEEIEKELEGTEFADEAAKEAEKERIKKVKLDQRSMEDRVKDKQAELAMEDREQAAKDKVGDDGKTALEAETEKALQARVDKKLQEESMTARLTKLGTQEQQDRISDELNGVRMEMIKDNLQKRLNKAFGTNMVEVGIGTRTDKDGNLIEELTFKTKKEDSSISVSSSDGSVLHVLGIENGESNKVNLNGKLSQSALEIDINDSKYSQGLVINGVTIGGIDANTSINTILSKINSSDAGVKATYVAASGQFMLVSKETGAGREISLDSELAKELFGGGEYVEGQDAQIDVSYGNGKVVTMERASNTFNLEGMTVTVSGVFGGDWSEGKELTEAEAEEYENGTKKLGDGQRIVEQDGKKVLQDWKTDTSAGVTFSSKADVDKVTEKVKKFFEDFNAIVTEVNKQVTTRPDSSYGPLTDEQKDEMSETSIENWENKAKSGLLFNDSTMRDLSMDIQSVYTKLMSQTGLSYEDLKELGISYSDNEKDGGILVFDESAFRSAMENKPEKVSALFTGGSGMGNGLVKIVEDTFTPYATRYATRNGNSYGRLIEEAGSEKIPTSLMKNQIYKEIKSKQERIESLRAKLKTEEDRYISMFTTMETMINKMNSQASYLSQITG